MDGDGGPPLLPSRISRQRRRCCDGSVKTLNVCRDSLRTYSPNLLVQGQQAKVMRVTCSGRRKRESAPFVETGSCLSTIGRWCKKQCKKQSTSPTKSALHVSTLQ